MVNQQILQGNWNEIKGKLRDKWGQLTNDEVHSFDGNVDHLVGMIQRKTGEARKKVEQFLEEVTENSSSTIADAAETMRDYAHQAADQFQDVSQQASDAVRQGYERAESTVRSRPAESIAVCFGVGIGVGLLLGLAIRR